MKKIIELFLCNSFICFIFANTNLKHNMNQSQYNQLFSFIWNIATDVLVYAFEKGDYKKIILPMMVLRRIDVLLEPTKQQLLTQKELLDKNNIQNQDPILYNATGYPLCA